MLQTNVENESLKDKLQELSEKILEGTKKKFDGDLSKFEKHLELQKSKFYSALQELKALMDLEENSPSEATKSREQEIIHSLKLSVKEAKRDSNQALESLAKS